MTFSTSCHSHSDAGPHSDHPRCGGWKSILLALASLFALTPCLLSEEAAVEKPAADGKEPHRTDWLHKAKWGVMFHYCSNMMNMMGSKDAAGNKINYNDGATWNKTIQDFDVPGLAKQLEEIGAGYFLITAKHCGNPIAPNKAYEQKNPGLCPKRDLIMDLADELAKHDIKLMLYYATGMGVPPVPDTAKASAAVIEEFSMRYGKKVAGWWLDNSVSDVSVQKIIADAARAGNPEAILAYNQARAPKRNSPYDDYTAGDTHAPGNVRCSGRFVSGAQWHILSPLSGNWAGICKTRGNPRFPTGKAVGITAGHTSRGGAVTWDVPYLASGLLDPAIHDQLKAIGQALAQQPGK